MIAAKARNAAFDLLVVMLFSLNLISVLFAAVLGDASGTDPFTTALQYVLTPLLTGLAILSVSEIGSIPTVWRRRSSV